MLRVDHLKVEPLPALSFAIADGECLAVEGPSGSGKTRLLRAIADLDDASGQVFVDGAERREIRAPKWRRRVRYATAEPVWWTDTAREVFATLAAVHLDRLPRLLSAVGLADGVIDRPLAGLSTGERQRISFVRAVIDEPRVLLLDEPTAGLDAHSATLVEQLIRLQLAARRSVLLVSHDDGQIERLADARLQLARPLAPRSGAMA